MRNSMYKILILCLLFAGFGLAEAATSITINFNNGSGDPITTGGVLKYHDNNGWQTATNNNDGTFTASVEGTGVTYQMNYNYASQTKYLTTATNPATFSTVTTTLALEDSDGGLLSGGSVKFHNTGWSTSYSSNDVVELLPVAYTVQMNYNNASQTKYSQSVSGATDKILFQTVSTTLALEDSDGNTISGGSVKFHNTSWSSSYSSNDVVELLPVSYTVQMNYNNASQTKYSQSLSGASDEFLFNTTQINYVFGGVIKFHNTNWGTYTQGMQFLPVSYTFQFGDQTFYSFQVSGCTMDGNVNIFKTVKHDGTPLPNVAISRNHLYSSYTNVGTTDANGLLFTTDMPNGTWKYKATKDNSSQTIISGPNNIKFQTSEFVTRVKHTDGSPFEGIETDYNHLYSSYMNVGTTDANGKTSIQLFPGDHKFKATKNNSSQVKNLEILTPGTSAIVDFQTSTFVTHVIDHSGNPLEGIQTQYNHLYSSYMGLTPSTTDANGDAWIELFPGTYQFKAIKNNSSLVKSISIPTSGQTISENFQTALAEAHVKDCDLNTGVAGVNVQYNHLYSSYMNISPSVTDASGIASIELFPGSHKFKATILNSSQVQTVNITGPVTTFEFNPTRVTFNYPGTVKYNHLYSSYMTIGANTYLFPGTYNFRFYNGNTLATQQSIAISGCSTNQALIFVQLKNSSNTGLAEGDFDYRYGSGSYTNLGVDNSGNGYWAFINGNPTNAEVKAKYKGTSFSKTQNVRVNPVFIFNTINVTADLFQSDDVTEITSGTTWLYRYGSGNYNTLNNTGTELLPVNTEIKVSYGGSAINKTQNVGTVGLNEFRFNTVNVSANLFQSDDATEITSGTTWLYRYGSGSYNTLTNSGTELLPVYTEVRVGYGGSAISKSQNVGTVGLDNYRFNTVNVTADLFEGSTEITSGATWLYRYGSGSYYTLTNTGTELLPVNTEVKVTYSSKSKSKTKSVSNGDSDFHFTWDGFALFKSTTDDLGVAVAPVKVYPNPSNGVFMIENVTNYYRLSVYDMTGRMVYQSDINDVNSQNIRLDNPVAGAYMIQLEGVGTTVSTPIMIK